MHKNQLTALVRRPQYGCSEADIEYGLQRAAAFGNDPFRVASALSQHIDDHETAARTQGLRAWLIVEFMRRRQLAPLTEKQESMACCSVVGQWPLQSLEGASELFDHTLYFKCRDWRSGYLLATRPFNPSREKWAEFGSQHGTHIEFVEDYPAWWAAMAGWPSILVVCTRQPTISPDLPATEQSARRAALRVGLVARKSRRDVDDRRYNQRGFQIIDPATHWIVAGEKFDLSTDDVIAICTRAGAH
jgi:hypothetical protein